MRSIRGAAPGASIAEMWAALRDDPGVTPNYGDQVAAFQQSQDYCAPSKAHRKRLLRPRDYSAPPRNTVQRSERELFMAAQGQAVRVANRAVSGKVSQFRYNASGKRFEEVEVCE